MASVRNMNFSTGSLPDVKRPERQVSGPAAPDQRSSAEKRQVAFDQEWEKQRAISNPRNTPPVSQDRMNQGGNPGFETRKPAPDGNFSSVNASAAGVGARTPVDAAPGSLDPLFQKSKASTLGSPKTVLKDGVYLPAGGALTGGMVNVGDIGSPQAGAMLGSNFTGQPSMYPVQQSVGNDIFGDTDALIRRRDELQAGMDRVFAKNPMGNDLMANFHTIASQANQRKEIREIGDRLAKRDELVSQLFGIGMQGQNQLATQGLQNQGMLQNTTLAGQLQQQNTGLVSQGQMAIQELAGKQGMDRTRAETASQMAIAQSGEIGATERNNATIKANADKKEPYDHAKHAADFGKEILKTLNDPNVTLTPEKRAEYEIMMKSLFGQSVGTQWATGIDK